MRPNTWPYPAQVDDEAAPRERSPSSKPDLGELGWWALTSDEAVLRESLPEHRPEYC